MSFPAVSERQRAVRRLLIVGFLIYVVVVLSVAAVRAREDQSSTSDFDDFWKTARHFISTGAIVEDFGVHNYLPFFVFFMAPLGLLPLKVASVVFNGLSLAGFVLSVRLMDRWYSDAADPGADPPFRATAGAGPPAADARTAAAGERGHKAASSVLPIVLVLPYVTGCLVMGQMALLTLAMLVLTWHAVQRRRDGSAGLWLALAISTKTYPLVLVPFFALKRKWRLCASCAAGLMMMNAVLPMAVLGPREAARLYVEFWRRSARGNSPLVLARFDSNKMSYANQSFAVVARRLSRGAPAGLRRPDGSPRLINVVDWPTGPDAASFIGWVPVQWLVVSWSAALTLYAAWRCRRPFAMLRIHRARREYSAFVVLSLLLSPIVWSFYYAVCCLPLAAALRRGVAERGPRRWQVYLVAGTWAFGIVALASPLLRAYGSHLCASLVLFLVLMSEPKEERSESNPA